jgi:hypothetical protein
MTIATTVPARAWPLTGIGFVLASASGILFSTLIAPEPYPSPFGAPLGAQTDIARYFVEARTQVELMSFFYTVGAVLLVAFTAYLASLIRAGETESSPWQALALGGGFLAAGFWQLSALLLWVLARPWTPDQPQLLRAVHDLTYLVGGPAHVLMLGLLVGSGALALPRTLGLPAFLRWVGVASAVGSLLTVLALLFDPATLLLPVSRGLGLLWISGVAASLAVSGRWPVKVGSRPAPTPTSRLSGAAR